MTCYKKQGSLHLILAPLMMAVCGAAGNTNNPRSSVYPCWMRHFTRLAALLFIACFLFGAASTVTGAPVCDVLWTFNGNATDASGNGNNGTVHGGLTYTTTATFGGITQQGAQFGNNIWVDNTPSIPNLPTAGNSPWTINFWAQLASPPTNFVYLAGYGATNTAQRAAITFTASNGFYFWGTPGNLDSGTTYRSDNAWHMYTITYNGTGGTNSLNMYIDGSNVKMGQPNTTGGTLAAATSYIIAGNAGSKSFLGALADFSVWTGALTSTQVGYLNNNAQTTGGMIWTGSGSTTWSTASTSPKNWTVLGDAADYTDGQGVQFGDSAGTATTIAISAANVTPSSVLFNNSAINYTLQGPYGISGITSLTKTGTGLLTITNSNAYTGSTTISGGTLQLGDGTVGHDGSLATSSVSVSGATLAYNLAGSQTPSYSITGTGGKLVKSGTGTLTLSGTNKSYTGSTTVSGGTLALADVGTSFASAPSIASTATLVLSASNSTVDTMILGSNNTITGSGTLVKTGSGWAQFEYGAIKDFSGQINVIAGTLGNAKVHSTWGSSTTGMGVDVASGAKLDLRGDGIAVGALTGSGSVVNTFNGTVNTPNTLTVGLNNATSTFSGAIVGDTGHTILVKTGTGTLTLNGALSYTGSTNLSGGTLALVNVGNGFVSSPLIASTATLVLSASSANVNSPMVIGNNNTSTAITGSGTLVKSDSGWAQFDYNVIKNFSGQINIQSGILGNTSDRSTWGTSTTGMGVDVASGAQLDLRGGAIAVGALTGSGSVVNTYTTGANTLTVGVNDATSTFSGAIMGTGAGGNGVPNAGKTILVKTGTGTLTLNGALAYTGSTNISGGTLALANVGASFVSSPFIASTATLVLSASNTLVDTMTLGYSNTGTAITGSGTIVKTDSGWAQFDYNVIKNFAGQINIQSGTLGNALARSTWGDSTTGMGVDVASGAKLDLRGDGITVGALTGSGSVVNTFNGTSNTLTVGLNNVSSTFSGAIVGDIGHTILVKTGTGTLTLNGGALSYTGSTNLSGGTLALVNAGTSFVSSPFIASTATLVLSTSSADINHPMVIGKDNTSTAITGSGTLVKSDTGWVQFAKNAIKNFSGQINIQAGTLGNTDNTSTWGTSATGMGVDVASGAKLDLRSGAITVGALTGSGSVVNTFYALPNPSNDILTVGVNDATSTFSGTIMGTGASGNGPLNAGRTILVKTGSGTLTLTGTNVYSGGTTLNAGTLKLGSNFALGSGGLTISSGTLDLHGFSPSLASFAGTGGVVTNEGTAEATLTISIPQLVSTTFNGNLVDGSSKLSLAKGGSGSLTLTSSNGFSGTASLNNGLVTMAHPAALSNCTVNLGLDNVLAFANGVTAPTIGGLQGTGGLTLTDAGDNAVTLSVGNNGTNTTYAGSLGGKGGLSKIGGGSLTLTNSSTTIGAYQLSAGTLVLANTVGSATGTGPLTVSGGLLTGSGATSGNVSILSGGTLAPGGSTIGTLGIAGNLDLAGLASFRIDTDLPLSNDKVVGINYLTYGGTLKIANSGSAPYANGQTWDLFDFSSGSQSGTFTNTFGSNVVSNLPTLDPTLRWMFDYPTGVLSVVNVPTFSGSATWTGASSALWNSGDNWIDGNSFNDVPGVSPRLPGRDTANFSGSGSVAPIILDANPNLKALTFSGTNYTLSGGSLTLESVSGPATVNVSGGTDTIGSALTLASATDITVTNAVDRLLISGDIGGTGALLKTGDGTLVLSGTNSYSGGTIVNVGTLIATTSAAFLDGSSLTVGAGGTLIFDPSVSGAPAMAQSQSLAVSPVPEPGTLALLGVAVCGAIVYRNIRSRRKK